MPEKSLEEILEKFAGLPKESSTWGKGYLDNYLKERNHLITQATQAIKDYYLGKLPKEKNFNKEVCMWRDDKDMIKEIRGECKGYNQAIAEIRKAIEDIS